ncbi:DMT family transporter [Nocardioides kribbensis]|uniref:DMT family transporter n=2 Tax=Nocardioides kribbensis TaxID=305517 RepID=UPI00187A0F0A|nr:DMT family transporter [Nocardioides kribbensis]
MLSRGPRRAPAPSAAQPAGAAHAPGPAHPQVPLVPAAAFVVVWSSGYIAGPLGVEAVEPITLLALRFVVATLLLGAWARWRRGPMRLPRGVLVRLGAVGLMMNGLQFVFMYLAFDVGLGATLGALMHSLSPVLTVVLAGVLLRERVTRVQVVGLVVGVAGVVTILGPDVEEAGGAVGLTLGVLSTLSLCLGTLGQRWTATTPASPRPSDSLEEAGAAEAGATPPGESIDPVWAAVVQFAVCAVPLVVLGLLLEGTRPVHDPVVAVATVAWLGVVNSIVGLLLLGAVVRRGGAGASASVFFLMPPVTAVMAWLCFGDTLDARELVGLVVAVLGVAVATRSARSHPDGGRGGSPSPGGRGGSPSPGGRGGSPSPGGRGGSPSPGGRGGSPSPGG